MKYLRRGQTSLEFTILLGFMLFVFTTFFYVMRERSEITAVQSRQAELQAVGDIIVQETGMAARVKDGYSRTFELPASLAAGNYTLKFTGTNEVIILTNDEEYIVFLPANMTNPSITNGKNTITKFNGTVNITPAIVPVRAPVVYVTDAITCIFSGAPPGYTTQCVADNGYSCSGSCTPMTGQTGTSVQWQGSATNAMASISCGTATSTIDGTADTLYFSCTPQCTSVAGQFCASPLPSGAVTATGSCATGACYSCGATLTNYCSASNSCVNTQTDTNNCGGCGTVCTSGQTCSNGVCTTSTVCTSTPGHFCASFPPLGSDAVTGTCSTGTSCYACSSSTPTYCTSQNSCKNLQTDVNNCGGCGSKCTAVACMNSMSCSAGSCSYSCTQGRNPFGICIFPTNCQYATYSATSNACVIANYVNGKACTGTDGRAGTCMNGVCSASGVTETVTCSFQNAITIGHTCTAETGESCSGKLSCALNVTEAAGDLYWTSSDCGGSMSYQDGVNEQITFDCSTPPPPPPSLGDCDLCPDNGCGCGSYDTFGQCTYMC